MRACSGKQSWILGKRTVWTPATVPPPALCAPSSNNGNNPSNPIFNFQLINYDQLHMISSRPFVEFDVLTPCNALMPSPNWPRIRYFARCLRRISSVNWSKRSRSGLHRAASKFRLHWMVYGLTVSPTVSPTVLHRFTMVYPSVRSSMTTLVVC